jgi:hypothetical protein
MMRYYLLNDDRTIREVEMMDWGMRIELGNLNQRNVGDDDIQDYRISTKFIGIDTTPAFILEQAPDMPPRPFETMVLGPDITAVIARVSTWQQADALHTGIVTILRSLARDAGPLTRSYIELTSTAILRGIERK